MKINSIELNNYRNYTSTKVDFADGLNIVVGNNAQGKTNLLEAIYFCCIGKSLRVSKEKDVIGWKAELAKVKLDVIKRYGKSKIEIIFPKNDKKTIKINSIPIKKIGELMGEFNAVFFSPDEMDIVKESPEDRRRFIDIDISQTSKAYFYLLGRYEKILANRNKLLKTQSGSDTLKETISIWDEQLAETGSSIILYRQKFLTNLEPFAIKAHAYLTDNKEQLKLTYTEYKSNTKDELKSELLTGLQKNLEKDLSLGYTSTGPQRDDIKITVNGIDIRTFGSQGQQRTVALSLKLAELEIIKNEIGEMPVLILDDVLSELDERRRKKLLKFCAKTQTFISCTEFNAEEGYEPNIIKIENGSVFAT